MQKRRLVRIGFMGLLYAAVCALVVYAPPETRADSPALDKDVQQAVGPVLFGYQGLLLDPSTSNPKPDGTYSITFALYDVQSGGTNLWSETKTIQVTKGLFSTMLGDQVVMPSSIYDGRGLWLGITVGVDPETAPRQRLGYSAGAVFARNSDQLDGQDASFFLNASNLNSGQLSNNLFSAYADLFAESRIGTGKGQVAAGDHQHDSRYVNKTGLDIMTGTLTLPGIIYSPARVDVTSVGGEHFVSRSNQPFINGGGMGGAYLISPTFGCLEAGLQLPQGAVVTQFDGFFYDNSSSDINIYLWRLSLAGNAYSTLTHVTSSGTPGYSSLRTSNLGQAPVDNTLYGYFVEACANPWDGINLRVMGASITYRISKAH